MKLNNFTIEEDLIALNVGDRYLDLHNNYTFSGYVKDKNSVNLSWCVTIGDWIPSNSPKTLTILIEDTSYFEARGEFLGQVVLDEMSFFENSTLGNVEYNGLYYSEPDYDLLLFRFIGGDEIAVMGGNAICVIDGVVPSRKR